MSKSDLTKYNGNNHEGSDNTAPYPASRMAPAFELVDLAKEIEQADLMIGQQTNAKLRVIAEQIRNLQNQAREILETAQTDQRLHRAKCNFKRQPGSIYHLYEKTNGETYFSMLSPSDWGKAPHHFVGSFRLEYDMSWTPAEKIEKLDAENDQLKTLLTHHMPE